MRALSRAGELSSDVSLYPEGLRAPRGLGHPQPGQGDPPGSPQAWLGPSSARSLSSPVRPKGQPSILAAVTFWAQSRSANISHKGPDSDYLGLSGPSGPCHSAALSCGRKAREPQGATQLAVGQRSPAWPAGAAARPAWPTLSWTSPTKLTQLAELGSTKLQNPHLPSWGHTAQPSQRGVFLGFTGTSVRRSCANGRP